VSLDACEGFFEARDIFCIVNWITQVEVEILHDAGTGWREPILISGQGKAVPASYCADGLVFFVLSSEAEWGLA
jgi:hypothetical protein